MTRTALATPAEVADYLRRSTKTLRNWRALRIGPPWQGHGRGVRYRWADVENEKRWLSA